MNPTWYVAKDKQKLGPYSALELKQMVRSGQLQVTEMVLKVGTEKWLPAAALKGLFGPPNEAPVLAVPSTAEQPGAEAAGRVKGVAGGNKLWLVGLGLGVVLALLGAAWFYQESRHYQAQWTVAEEKLRLLASQGDRPTEPLGNHPPKTSGGENSPTSPPASASSELLDKLKADLKKLQAKGEKDSLDLQEAQKTITQLSGKTKEDALALEGLKKARQEDALVLSGLQTSLSGFQKAILEKLGQDIKLRLDTLDKKALAQEETLAALRKELGLPVQDEAPLALIDKYALAAPAEAERSLESLAKYLTTPFRSDKEKVRAIFCWVTDRIRYDVSVLLTKDFSKQTAEKVLSERVGVCQGYANLFEKLCQLADLEAVYVSGLTPGPAKGVPQVLEKHAWNAVKIQGKWQLVDTTWAAGVLKNNVFEKQLNDLYFLPPPELMLFGHLPTQPQWQVLEPPLSDKEVESLFELPRPVVLKMYELGISEKVILQQALKNQTFRANLSQVKSNDILTLHKLGMLSGNSLFETLSKETFSGFVNPGLVPGLDLVIHKAPLAKVLLAGTTLEVEVVSPGITKAAIIHNGKFVYLSSKGNQFAGKIVLPPGEVKLAVLQQGQVNTYRNILIYTVLPADGKIDMK